MRYTSPSRVSSATRFHRWHGFGLADAVDAAEALLDAVRIPRQVVVHHQVRALEVDALASRIGRDEHLHRGVELERFLRLCPFLASHAAVDDNDGVGVAEKATDATLQVVERVAMLGEDDELLVDRRHRAGNVARSVGGLRLAGPTGCRRRGEDLAQQARQLAPLRVQRRCGERRQRAIPDA